MSGGGGSGFCGRVKRDMTCNKLFPLLEAWGPPSSWLPGWLYGKGEVWAVVGGRERCHPGGDGKGCPRAGGGPAAAGVLCYCLPSSTYSPEENVLLALSCFLYCADSELFILSCN